MISTTLNIENLRKKKLFIATPMYGGMCHATYVQSLIELVKFLSSYQIESNIYFSTNESLIPRARNACVNDFLKTDCTHLLFIDSDIGFSFKDIIFLLHSVNSDKDGYNIMCAPYPLKTLETDSMREAVLKGLCDKDSKEMENFSGKYFFGLTKGKKYFKINEPVEVSQAGTGLMMIDRSVFEKMIEKCPFRYYYSDNCEPEKNNKKVYAFFDCGIDTDYDENNINFLFDLIEKKCFNEALKTVNEIKGKKSVSKEVKYLSEDYFFIKEAGKIGIKTWICPWMATTHTGAFTFKGSFKNIAELGNTPTAKNQK